MFAQLRMLNRCAFAGIALPRQPAFVVDQGELAGCGVAPAPEDQIEVVIARPMGEAAHQQSMVAVGQKPCGEGLRRGFAGGHHPAARPVYVDFTQSANELLRLRCGLENGALTNAGSGQARVLLRLDDGGEYVHTGRLFIPGI